MFPIIKDGIITIKPSPVKKEVKNTAVLDDLPPGPPLPGTGPSYIEETERIVRETDEKYYEMIKNKTNNELPRVQGMEWIRKAITKSLLPSIKEEYGSIIPKGSNDSYNIICGKKMICGHSCKQKPHIGLFDCSSGTNCHYASQYTRECGHNDYGFCFMELEDMPECNKICMKETICKHECHRLCHPGACGYCSELCAHYARKKFGWDPNDPDNFDPWKILMFPNLK